MDGARNNLVNVNQWNDTYATKGVNQRSWTQEVPTDSLFYIDALDLPRDAPIIDIGGGSSKLVDELLTRSFTDLSVLDISSTAIHEAQGRVNAERVQWLLDDITRWQPTRQYALWHDRAVFHFLVHRDQQLGYVGTAASSVMPGGHVLLATFAPSGPQECSGLAVHRWVSDELAELFCENFTLITSDLREHVTPWGSCQPFTWALLQRRAD